jgi:hypothetical protein
MIPEGKSNTSGTGSRALSSILSKGEHPSCLLCRFQNSR